MSGALERCLTTLLAIVLERKQHKMKEREDLIAFGDRVGFPHVPGEDLKTYRKQLVELRDEAARRERREKAQERAELITMGLLCGVEYVPGENLDDFRLLVMQARAKAAEKEGRRA